MIIRFSVYGVLGWCAEILFTALTGLWRRPSQRLRLEGRTQLWVFPLYGSAAWLFEPLHDMLRDHALGWRVLAYGTGILLVELCAGLILQRLLNRCPWEYPRSRFTVKGVIRLDYLPLWGLLGVGLEQVHDRLDLLIPLLETLKRLV